MQMKMPSYPVSEYLVFDCEYVRSSLPILESSQYHALGNAERDVPGFNCEQSAHRSLPGTVRRRSYRAFSLRN